MKRSQAAIVSLAIAFLALLIPPLHSAVFAQKNKKVVDPATLLTRTITRHEVRRLQFGGTVSITGAPVGSITIQGWERPELEVNADIVVSAPTQQDLDRLAVINNFVLDEDPVHMRIMTTGTHDPKFLKRVAKDLPKSLIGLPWKIDYRINVPAMTDLEIDNGTGAIKLAGVEGALSLNALQSDADLSLTGGLVSATIQRGSVNLTIPTRGWHGLGSEIRLATGQMTINLMPGFSADLNADVLRLGEIKTTFPDLQNRSASNSRSMRARSGTGGATLNFTVGDGIIEIKPLTATP